MATWWLRYRPRSTTAGSLLTSRVRALHRGAQDVTEVVQSEVFGQGQRLLEGEGVDLHIVGFAAGGTPPHQSLGEGPVNGQLTPGNPIRLLPAQCQADAFTRVHGTTSWFSRLGAAVT